MIIAIISEKHYQPTLQPWELVNLIVCGKLMKTDHLKLIV